MMDNLKEIIEGILFVSGDGVALEDIADKLQVDIDDIKRAISELKEEKEKSNSGIQVILYNNMKK